MAATSGMNTEFEDYMSEHALMMKTSSSEIRKTLSTQGIIKATAEANRAIREAESDFRRNEALSLVNKQSRNVDMSIDKQLTAAHAESNSLLMALISVREEIKSATPPPPPSSAASASMVTMSGHPATTSSVQAAFFLSMINSALTVSYEGLGVKNIYSYRRKIAHLLTSHTTAETAALVFKICIAVNSRRRILDGLMEREREGDPYAASLMKFFRDHTCDRTSDQLPDHSNVATVKIAASFPEYCAFLYCFRRSNRCTAMELVSKMWMVSISLAEDARVINRAAVERAWNSWGKSTHTQMTLSFDENIYEQSAMDNLSLVDDQQDPWGSPPYTMQDLEDYCSMGF